MSSEQKWLISEELCKGCGICVARCPRKVLVAADHLSAKGYHPARMEREDLCNSCAVCARACPEVAIEIYR